MGVLVSGRGTNLRALVEASCRPEYPAEVVAVASNRAACPALALARDLGLAARAFPATEHGGDEDVVDGAVVGLGSVVEIGERYVERTELPAEAPRPE